MKLANRSTDEQDAFINFSGPESVILNSTAGSGKSYSCVGRMNKMIADGVDPSRIIFFSFTNDAVDELKTRIKVPVVITTIHAYTSRKLAQMGMFKPISTFYAFTAWFKEAFKPKHYDNAAKKMEFQRTIDKFYEDGNQISASFSAYKLQDFDDIKVAKPKYFDQYQKFLRETKSRDFSDMLIDTERLSKHPQYINFFENTYDYVFIDEYQDTSTLQLKILLAIKAKQYFLAGDANQSIFGFSGANCEAIEKLLKSHKSTIELKLTKNFRSKRSIVRHSNEFSSLEAIPHSTEEGITQTALINEDTMFDMISDDKPLTILVRTNKVIKEIEKICLRKKLKMRYFNYFTHSDIDHIKSKEYNISLKKRIEQVAPYFGGEDKLLKFIEDNSTSENFVTSIHKSKGREYPRVIVVNSLSPEQLSEYPDMLEEYSFINAKGEEDEESRNVYYVATTRPKDELYFLIYDM